MLLCLGICKLLIDLEDAFSGENVVITPSAQVFGGPTGVSYVLSRPVFSHCPQKCQFSLPTCWDSASLTYFCKALFGACLCSLWCECNLSQCFVNDLSRMSQPPLRG